MPKRVKTSSSPEKKKTHDLNEQVLENLIQLQKVHTDLAEKFDKLTKEISSLLSLFELAAKSFSKYPGLKSSEQDKEFLEKIDKLLEQNKTIAKGLTLMEEKVRQSMYSPQPQVQQQEQYFPESYTIPQRQKRPLPRF